jgi:alanine racemase
VIELADLLAAMVPAGARLVGSPIATQFEGFAYDSRNLKPGEIFVAVRTARADGHDFIPDAIRRGAAAIVCDRTPGDASAAATTIVVDDTLLALRSWARFAVTQYAPQVISVIGSVGKSTAAKAVVAVLGQGFAGDPAIFDGDNHNTPYGLSIALGRLTATHRVAVLELARDGPGDLLELAEITRPTIAVVVSAFADSAANCELASFLTRLPATGAVIVNADDPVLARLYPEPGASGLAVLRYGQAPTADVRAEDVAYQLGQTRFDLVCRGASITSVRVDLSGEPALYGALAGAAVGRLFGYLPEEIAASLDRLAPLAGRLRLLAGCEGSMILDDSFDANSRSLPSALDVLERSTGRKIVVLGELTQLDPSFAAENYRAMGSQILGHAAHLITVGPVAEAAANVPLAVGATPAAVAVADSAHDAAALARSLLGPGDVVLVAGGTEARLERVVEELLAEPEQATELLVRQNAGWKQRVFLSRERPTWVEVDLAAIGQNVTRLKEIASPADLMAVLKADAYGHGAVRVARTALLHGASYLATACLSEAIALRRHGISAPILILGFTPPWQATEIVRNDLTATVYSLETVRHLARAAQTLGRHAARVQIKVDTGMARLGLLPHDVPSFVEAVRAIPGVEVEGIYTHFASADAADPSPTLQQIARFEAVLKAIERAGWQPRYVHAANSAAILRFPESRYSLVRAGIALYGLDPSDVVRCPADFRPTITFKTLVAQVKDLPPGSPISYGGTFVTSRPSCIAVLPVGYGDGFRRSPRNWDEVLIRGQRAPIVGVVCMDMCMIDVTDVPGVRAGDEVVLIGRQGHDQITVAEIAQKLGTIPYEVITQILARVPREVPPGS